VCVCVCVRACACVHACVRVQATSSTAPHAHPQCSPLQLWFQALPL